MAKYGSLVFHYGLGNGFHGFQNHDGIPVGKKDNRIGNSLDIFDCFQIDENLLLIELGQKYHDEPFHGSLAVADVWELW